MTTKRDEAAAPRRDDAAEPRPASRRRRAAPPDAKRGAQLDAMADHLLAHGLGGSSLRALAAAAGTSDRMLLYDFADKDELLSALLAHVATRLTAMLGGAGAGAGDRAAPAELLAQLWAAATAPTFGPYMLLFLELAVASGRGHEPHRTAAGRIAGDFTAWVADRLDVPEAARPAQAALLLATLDGLFLLHSAGRGADAARAAALFVSRE